MPQIFFHLVFVFVFVAFMGIRAYYYRKATRLGGERELKEDRLTLARRILGIPFVLILLGYMIYPPLLSWATLPLPLWAQWLGVILVLGSLALIWWVQWALDLNFSHILHLRQSHTLVTYGPYRWVRHPMYTTLYMHGLATLLLTRNWLIGGAYLLSLTAIILLRLKNEEALMLETFGEDYRAYMEHTGRFLPGF